MMRALSRETEKLFEPIPLHPSDRMEISINKDATKFILNLYRVSSSSELRNVPSAHASRTFIARLPERKQLTDGVCKWESACTDITCALIDTLWKPEQLLIEDDAKIVFDYLLTTCTLQEQNADRFALFKQYQERHNADKSTDILDYVPEVQNIIVHPTEPLSPYQKVACVNSLASDAYGLLMEQGTGKTPVAIARVCNEAPALFEREKRMMRVLIGCPKNVRMNWQNEFKKFSTCKGKTVVMRGDELKRVKCMVDAITPEDNCMYTVLICSYNAIVLTWSKLKNIPWDLAILDEGHNIRNVKTKRAQCALQLRDVSEKRMLLTGSPICNTALDLYLQLEFLRECGSGFRSWKNFKNFYGVYVVKEDGYKALVGMQNMAFMQERLTRMCFTCSKEEVLPDLPEKQYDIIEVEMTPQQADIYKQVAEQLAYEIEAELSSDDGSNKQMMINNVLTKLLRLAQITSSILVWDTEFDEETNKPLPKRIDYIPNAPKIEAIVELLKTKGPKEKTVIWSCWIPEIELLHERLQDEGIKGVLYYGSTSDADRDEAERAFNFDADCKYLLGNAGAGGTGLNLLGYPPGQGDLYDTNADHTIYMSMNWSAVNRNQSEDRNHRRGTRVNIRVSDLCVPGTIDEEIRERVVEKRMHAKTVSDLRQIVRSVLQKVYQND